MLRFAASALMLVALCSEAPAQSKKYAPTTKTYDKTDPCVLQSFQRQPRSFGVTRAWRDRDIANCRAGKRKA
jgi:hypothetical protein